MKSQRELGMALENLSMQNDVECKANGGRGPMLAAITFQAAAFLVGILEDAVVTLDGIRKPLQNINKNLDRIANQLEANSVKTKDEE